MKGEIGTFLALTGHEVKDSELVGLGLVNSLLGDTEGLANEIYQAQVGTDHTLNFNKYRNTWSQDYENQKMSSDLKNDMKLRNYTNVDYTNTLSRYQDILDGLLSKQNNDYLSLDEHMKEINRNFRFNTIEEINQALMEEDSVFSKYCLERMKKKSPLSLSVILRMLRNARGLDYSEIINQEVTVVKNIVLRSKEFDTHMGNKLNGQKTQFEDRKVSTQEVDSYFDESEINGITLDLQKHSLLPNRDYIHKYPDCLKFLINENRRANEHVRKYFDYESFHYLMTN
jgi:hypothetical protein